MSKCFFCNAKAEKKCGKCNFVNYCSRDCQVVDWRKTHKFFCESLPFPKRDSYEKSVYGFLLNPTGDLKIVKVALDKGGETPVLAPFLDPLGTLKSEMKNFISPFKNYMLPRKLYEEKNLDNTLQFNYRDNFLYDGSSPNKCIQKIAGNRNGHDWRGPMLVLKIKDVDPINFGKFSKLYKLYFISSFNLAFL
jgi:hypothetical protein